MKYILSIIFLFNPFLSYGQNEFCTPGTIEIGGDIGLSSSRNDKSGGGSSIFISNIFAGIMVLPGFEIGIRPGFIIEDDYSGLGNEVYNMFLNPSYNIKTDSYIYPFLGIIAGYNMIQYSGKTKEGLGIGGEGGIKFNLKGSCNFLVRIEYLSQHYDSDSFSNLSLGLGFRMFFEGKPKLK